MSVLDLKDAFHSLRLTESSKNYCGILPYFGSASYLYQRMPMGLNISQAVWQSYINAIINCLSSRKYCEAIKDDLLLFTPSKEAHYYKLEELLRAMCKNGLKISPKKCQLFKTKLQYMGKTMFVKDRHVCVKPLRSRIEAIQQLKPPTNAKGCRSIAGMVNFISIFCPELQKLLKPIYELTKKGRHFIWGKEQDAFDEIKARLQKPPVLSMPDKRGRFTLYYDRSKHTTGSELYQVQDGSPRLIAYVSKRMLEAAKNYSIAQLEMCGLAINIASFAHLLKRVDFDAVVDHLAIAHIMKSKAEPASNRIKRLLEIMSIYSFNFHYIKGKDVVLSDFLSRQHGDISNLHEIMPISFNMGKILQQNYQNYNKPIIIDDDEPTLIDLDTKKGIDTQVRDTTVTKTSDKPIRQSNRGILYPEPIARPLPKPLELIDKSVESKQSVNSTPNVDFKENSPHQEGIILETYINPDQSYFKRPQELIDLVNTTKLVQKYLPRQMDIDKILDIIKRKVLKGTHLPLTIEEIQAGYLTSLYFKDMYKYLAQNILPRKRHARQKEENLSERYILLDSLLFKLIQTPGKEKALLAIPEICADKIITLYPTSLFLGHQGVIKTYLTISDKFFVPNLMHYLKSYLKACHICQLARNDKPPSRQLQARINLNYKPMSRLSMDLKVMPRSQKGHCYILCVIDKVTNYLVTAPIYQANSEEIGDTLIESVISKFGIPEYIIMDQDSAFMSTLMNYLLKGLGIKIKTVGPYNHQSLQAEHGIKSLSNILTKYLTGQGQNWNKLLCLATFMYNTFNTPNLRMSNGTIYKPSACILIRYVLTKPPRQHKTL